MTDDPVVDEDLVPNGETDSLLNGNVRPIFRNVLVKLRLLRIMHNPSDEVGDTGWGNWDPHPRKNKLSFLIYPHKDRFVIYVDQG